MPSIAIKGMTCEHCKASVSKAISGLPGIKDLTVDLSAGKASWKDENPAAPTPVDKVKEVVRKVGFEAP